MNPKATQVKKLSVQVWVPVVALLGLIAAAIEILLYHTLANHPAELVREHHTMMFALLGGGTIIFLLSFVYVLRKNLFSPFAELKRHTNALNEGNYKSRMNVSTQNEFVPIAATINTVTEKLEQFSSENIDQMRAMIADLNNSTKLLIQRDLELTRANEKLRELDKMKSEFVSLATHQLRTPLSGVRWSLSMLINGEIGELTPEQKLYMMKTYESNNRMILLINDMLQADRVESGTLKFKFTQTNVQHLMENVLIELTEIANKRKVKVTFEHDPDLPLLTIDPENMRIVLQNLVDNAIKYSRENTEVNVEMRKKDTDLLITVKDHGIGIPEANQANIFKRFFRAPNAVHTETDGSGLGLYIVESIIQKHHGTIRFESKENEGTTFYVTLPITKNE